MDKATPRPWVMRKALSPVDGAYDYAISGNDVSVLAETFGRSSKGAFIDAEANAALIVRAVNSYEALVEALEKIARDRGSFMGEYHADCMAIARAALKSAKGES